MPRKNQYIGGIIGADPLPSGSPRPGVSNLGSLGGDGAASGGDSNWDDVVLLLDGSSVTDASGAGNNFTNSGATPNATPSPDHPYAIEPVAFDFPTGAGTNTTQEYLYSSAGAFDDLDNGDPFTIELWATADLLGSATTYRGLFGIGGYSTTTGLSIRTAGTTVSYWVGGASYTINHQVSLNTNDWFHIALVYDGSVSTLFVDGIPSSSTSSRTPTFGTNAVAVIGRTYGGTAGYHWNGQITDVRITKGVARYTADFSTDDVISNPAAWPKSAPVAGATKPTRRWGGITGRSLVESSAAGGGDANWNDVEILIDGTSLTQEQSDDTLSITNSGSILHSTEYKFNQGQAIYGAANNYIAVNDVSLSPGTGDFTVEFWAKGAAALANNSLWSMHNHSNSGPNVSPTVMYLQAFSNSFNLKIPSGSVTAVTLSTLGVTYTNWNHYAIVRSGSTIQLFVNGKLGISSTDSTNITAPWQNFGNGYPGLSGGQYGFNGYWEQIRVTVGVARYYEASGTVGTQTFTAPTTAFPATGVATSTTLPTTGVLSLAEDYQSKL